MNFEKVDSVYTYEIEKIPVTTGDLVCTVDGGAPTVSGHFWWVIGKLIPGTVDHIVIYTGPGGRCVEAGAKRRVITFDVPVHGWDGEAMEDEREFIDHFFGVAYPLANSNKTEAEERSIRIDIANYCIEQAKLKKPYNINFFDYDTEDKFYCSQLAYKAYNRHNIDLNTDRSITDLPFTEKIIYPQEIWDAYPHKKA